VNGRLMMMAAVAAIAASAVGCGGGAGGSTSEAQSGGPSIATSSLDKTEFVKKASAACQREREGLPEEASVYLSKHGSKGLSESVVIANMAKAVMVPTIEAEIAAIRKLGAPAGDEEQIEAILAAQQKALDEVKGLKEAKSIEAILAHFGDANKMLKDYGFTACTQ
jgi:hypothetical protein